MYLVKPKIKGKNMRKIFVSSMIISCYLSTCSLFALTLDELKGLCRQHEGNTQTLPFTSRFSCKEDRTFFSKAGNDRLMLTSNSEISYRASIKDDKFATAWSQVPSAHVHQELQCPVYEQWQAMASYDETIHSCDQLDQIVNEQEYCQEKLKDIWAECAVEMAQNPFVVPSSSRCQYVKTTVTKSCVNSPSTTDHHHSSSSSSSSHSHSSQSSVSSASSVSSVSSSDEEGVVLHASVTAFGAVVEETTVSRGFMHGSHKAIVIRSVPEANSLLHKLGLQEGFVVSRVNDVRTRDLDTFVRMLRLASAQEQVSIEFKGQGDEFETRRVAL